MKDTEIKQHIRNFKRWNTLPKILLSEQNMSAVLEMEATCVKQLSQTIIHNEIYILHRLRQEIREVKSKSTTYSQIPFSGRVYFSLTY